MLSLSYNPFFSFQVGVWEPGTYRVVLNTDAAAFGGHGRVDEAVAHATFPEEWAGRRNHMCLYIPCRTAQVLAKQ